MMPGVTGQKGVTGHPEGATLVADSSYPMSRLIFRRVYDY